MVRRALVALACAGACLAGGAAPAAALDDGLARTPPMGFNNWNSTHCRPDFNEAMIKATADIFVASGLKEKGYEYVNLDDCWALPQRDEDGNLQVDRTRFPNGIKALADYVHARGLKIGIYTSAGTMTCNALGFPGALGHEYRDAALFASWDIDYLKYDNCNNQGVDAVQRYTKMRDALKATGRPIVYSICEWGQNEPWLWGKDVGHLWRTTGDISDNWASVVSIVKQNMVLAEYAGPGHWNDPDMLEVGNGGMTDTEYRSHFSLWAIMAAPLLIGSDLREATPETMEILGNEEVIAVDQDRLGVQGEPIRVEDGRYVFVKPLADGDRAVVLFNETNRPARIATSAAEIGLRRAPAYRLRDLWAHASRETAGTIAATVPAHGSAMFRVSPDRRWFEHPPAVDASVQPEEAYPGAAAAVAPGSVAEVQTAATNAGRVPAKDVRVSLTAPDGWSVSASGPVSAATLGTDESLSTPWELAVPAGARPGSYDLSVAVTYRWPGARRTETVRSTAEVVVPVAPPGGVSSLSDVTWLSSTNGWGPVERDESNGEQGAGDGGPLTIQGVRYEKGLGVHAPSTIEYYLGGACTRFSADVGLDDEEGSAGTMTFEVWADGEKVADSGPMTNAMAARTLEADLTAATFLRLVATDGGDGIDHDHGDWADAQLECELRPPPAGTSFLSDLPWQRAANGWGPVERDRSVGNQAAGDGRPISIEGVTYEKGLGAHAPGEIAYHLGGRCSVVETDVGVDDEVTGNGTVAFEIWADAVKVAESGVMTWSMPARRLTADVSGAETLRLVVTTAGDGTHSDHADWADARVTCA
jgi:alpha-galactosidase